MDAFYVYLTLRELHAMGCYGDKSSQPQINKLVIAYIQFSSKNSKIKLQLIEKFKIINSSENQIVK